MPSLEPFRIFTRRLDELGLRYMVTGSVAAIYYGEPRLTNDVDLVGEYGLEAEWEQARVSGD